MYHVGNINIYSIFPTVGFKTVWLNAYWHLLDKRLTEIRRALEGVIISGTPQFVMVRKHVIFNVTRARAALIKHFACCALKASMIFFPSVH